MDNITHTLTGLALSRAGLDRFYVRAPLLLMISANMPDMDLATVVSGGLYYFEQHRGITHSVVMAPLVAILPLLFVLLISRSRAGWLRGYCLSLVGVLSHLTFDWTNAYGIRLLKPVSGQWFHADLNNIVDVWIWAVLILAWLGPLLGRLVSSEIGAKPGRGRGLAIFALLFIIAYDGGRYLIHERVLAALNSRVYEGSPPILSGAFPVAVNPLRWVAWVNTERLAIRYEFNAATEFDPLAGTKFYRPENTPAIDAAKTTLPVQVMRNFALYPLWILSPTDEPEGGTRVELRDERFPFVATAIVNRSAQVVSSNFHY
ncbi:MAG: metal-dependent hydrolase [Acidobacteriaceae bacterium]|nr:metal-dependent hydrolase [Acidobacteriaceae bacterium]